MEIELSPYGGLSEVAARIADQLRLKSVHAVYEGCFARCVTMVDICGYCEFEIRLFRTKSNVLVEVQMSRGNPQPYRLVADAVLDAAQGRISERVSQNQPLPLSMKLPCSSEFQKLEIKTDVLEVLENASELIQKDRVDACVIGMESLAVLTRREKVGDKVSSLSSRAVLLGNIGSHVEKNMNDEAGIDDDEDAKSCSNIQRPSSALSSSADEDSDSDHDGNDDMGFMSIIFSLVRDSKLHPEDGDNDSSLRNPSYQWYSNYLRHLAFSVLLHSLQVIAILNPCLQMRVARNFEQHGLFASLVGDISRVRESPHEAWYAVRILTILVSASEESRQLAIHLGVLSAVEGAHLFGLSSHTLLAKDSSTLMNILRMEPLNQ